MKNIIFQLLLLTLSMASCSESSSRKINLDSVLYNLNDTSRFKLIDSSWVKNIDTNYMHTGFYFLTVEKNGIRKRQEKSDEIYIIAPKPFASVDNIIKTKLEKNRLDNGEVYTELCLTFDAKGTKDLKEGTGNYLHPKMAVVIANKLLYIVDNNVNIKTGVMCIGLVDYSEEEMETMQKAVDNKE
jgi:hypothetical protein